jgi:hypothetical protein
MLKVYFFRFKIILRSNVFLGIFYFLKKKIQKKNKYANINHSKMIDVIGIEGKKHALIKFAKNKKVESKLIEEANLFTNGYIKIYNKKILFKDYLVDKFNQNRDKQEIYNRDIRFHWEIYRNKFLFNISFAYLLTKDEKYAISIIDFLKNWKKHSPCIENKIVYNGMEASIKLMNLSLIEPIIKNSIYYTKTIEKEFNIFLIYHAEYVYENYEITKYGLESNHGLTCSVGLIYASLLFPDFKNSKKWAKLGYQALNRSLRNQFTVDGVNFESSVNYHRFVFEILTFLLAALYKCEKEVDSYFKERVKEIGNSLIKLTHSNNMISRFGDNDGGKFFFDENNISNFNNMEYLSWFTTSKNKSFLETIIFSDIQEFNGFLDTKKFSGKVGKYITFKNDEISLIATANEIGTKGKGNHQHNDFLSFELYGENPFIVDPWSSCYTGDSTLRNNDRKTLSHNNVMIDKQELVKFDNEKLFEMLGNIKTKILVSQNNNKKFVVCLSHNGYKKLKNGRQLHERNIIVDKANNSIKIIDVLSGVGKHLAVINFHIPKKIWELKKIGKNLFFNNEKEEFIIINEKCQIEVNDGIISDNFLNSVVSHQVILKKIYINNTIIETIIKYKKK